MMEYTQLERAVLEWMASHLEIPNLKRQIQAAVPTGHIDQLEMYANGDRFSESITTFELKAWRESND